MIFRVIEKLRDLCELCGYESETLCHLIAYRNAMLQQFR